MTFIDNSFKPAGNFWDCVGITPEAWYFLLLVFLRILLWLVDCTDSFLHWTVGISYEPYYDDFFAFNSKYLFYILCLCKSFISYACYSSFKSWNEILWDSGFSSLNAELMLSKFSEEIQFSSFCWSSISWALPSSEPHD